MCQTILELPGNGHINHRFKIELSKIVSTASKAIGKPPKPSTFYKRDEEEGVVSASARDEGQVWRRGGKKKKKEKRG